MGVRREPTRTERKSAIRPPFAAVVEDGRKPVRIIGLEEHFATRAVIDAWLERDPGRSDPAISASTHGVPAVRLLDLARDRLAAMDEVGIDMQVLSLTTPGLHDLPAAQAVDLQHATNDLIAATVCSHPDRFQGFATLATPAPRQAARELERAVTELGLNGAMLFGRTGDRNLDHPDFWPILETAAALRAPLYLHPQTPPSNVRAAYYDGLGAEVSGALATHGLGWHYDAGIQLLRLILAGVFDRLPDLQIIVGHWGEVMLFYLDRIDQLAAVAKLQRKPSDYVRSNVLVTPGEIFSHRYLRWAVEVIGADRILFATDYPFVPVEPGGARRFLNDADLTQPEREGIASGNWDRICAGIRR